MTTTKDDVQTTSPAQELAQNTDSDMDLLHGLAAIDDRDLSADEIKAEMQAAMIRELRSLLARCETGEVIGMMLFAEIPDAKDPEKLTVHATQICSPFSIARIALAMRSQGRQIIGDLERFVDASINDDDTTTPTTN